VADSVAIVVALLDGQMRKATFGAAVEFAYFRNAETLLEAKPNVWSHAVTIPDPERMLTIQRRRSQGKEIACNLANVRKDRGARLAYFTPEARGGESLPMKSQYE